MITLQNVEKSKLYTFYLPSNRALTELGRSLTKHIINDLIYRKSSNWRSKDIFDIIGDKENADITIDGYRYRGKLLTRVEQFLYQNFDINLPDSTKCKLSNIFSTHIVGGDEPLYIDFVDYIRWKPGTFGEDPHSCWWGGYAHGKRSFIDEMKLGYGIAIRLFKPQNAVDPLRHKSKRIFYKNYVGMGRCFAFLNENGSDILFNGYGLQAREFAAIFLHNMAYNYQARVSLINTSGVYINGAVGYALSVDPITQYLFKITYVGRMKKMQCPECLGITRFSQSIGMCEDCQTKYMMVTANGRYVRKDDPALVKIDVACPSVIRDRHFIETLWYLKSDLPDYVKQCKQCKYYVPLTTSVCPLCKGVDFE